MEFIEGRTLIEYAEERHLNPRARLELMAKICDAVEHAHQRGMIHRDLKPANILVDEAGQPKILDFGVARVTDCDTEATRQTEMGQLIGTLAYMSPEQVSPTRWNWTSAATYTRSASSPTNCWPAGCHMTQTERLA